MCAGLGEHENDKEAEAEKVVEGVRKEEGGVGDGNKGEEGSKMDIEEENGVKLEKQKDTRNSED